MLLSVEIKEKVVKIEDQIDMRAIADELRIGFINYQWNLENPMTMKSQEELRIHYLTDGMFHRKVDSITCAVVDVIQQNIRKQGENHANAKR